MITFENQNGRRGSKGVPMWEIDVRLDGKIVGTVKHCADGYFYVAKGSRRKGEIFETLVECKQSLVGE